MMTFQPKNLSGEIVPCCVRVDHRACLPETDRYTISLRGFTSDLPANECEYEAQLIFISRKAAAICQEPPHWKNGVKRK